MTISLLRWEIVAEVTRKWVQIGGPDLIGGNHGYELHETYHWSSHSVAHPRLGVYFPFTPKLSFSLSSRTSGGKRCTMLRPRLRIPMTTPSFSYRAPLPRLPRVPPSRTCFTSAHSSCWNRKVCISYRTFLKAEIQRPTVLPSIAVGGYRKFHATSRVQYSPILALVVGVLKVCFQIFS